MQTQSSDQSHPALTSSHTPPSPPFLPRSGFLEEQVGAMWARTSLASAKPRDVQVSPGDPGPFLTPRGSGNVFGLSLEAAKWHVRDSESRGQA